LNGDELRGNISYDGYTSSFMEEGNFYQWNEAKTEIGSESKFIFNTPLLDLDYLIQENDAA
jgi:hypothetical protein